MSDTDTDLFDLERRFGTLSTYDSKKSPSPSLKAPPSTAYPKDSDSEHTHTSSPFYTHPPSPKHTPQSDTPSVITTSIRLQRTGIMDLFSPSSGGLTFTGTDRGMSAEEYLELVEAAVDRLGMSDAVKEDRQRISIFRTGLRKRAKEWFDAQKKEDRKNWDTIKRLFEERFPETDGTQENTKTVREALLFARANGETITSFITRANKIHRKLPPTHQKAFVERVFVTINDGEKDVTLQQRVSDRLFHKDKLDAHGVPKNCTFSELKNTIELCVNPVHTNSDDSDTGDEDDTNPMLRLLEKLEHRDERTHETYDEDVEEIPRTCNAMMLDMEEAYLAKRTRDTNDEDGDSETRQERPRPHKEPRGEDEEEARRVTERLAEGALREDLAEKTHRYQVLRPLHTLKDTETPDVSNHRGRDTTP
ncbi:hypothetical protein CSUB01_12543 [Colletotrichum sublineola]|uniref:Retrotransposon gag domain-containing protein n=1 Tax=Colletotrichum sublineola TaxID=1173701 RepID=A0A066WU79_COLSU|nr:hypothetical protein CSUB01_12543 [Colletotrichum sublineola]